MLVASGVDVTADALVDRVYVPGRRGSLQPEMSAAVRDLGRVSYRIQPTEEALLAELLAGRPVLVLQNLGVRLIPRWHYAVVIGVDPSRDSLVLRSGTERRRITRRGVFLRTWGRSGNWGLVVPAPGELPEIARPADVVRELAAAEGAGRLELAAAGYRAALERWPDNQAALLGLGNIARTRGDLSAAETWFRRALDLAPDSLAALNNLAETLGRLGRLQEARVLADRALALAGTDHPLAPVLRDTRDGLSGGPGAPQD